MRIIHANFLDHAGLNKTVPDRIIALRLIDDAGFAHFLNLGGAELEGLNKAASRFDRCRCNDATDPRELCHAQSRLVSAC